MRLLRTISLLLALLIGGVELSLAQYYSWGADRASLKWSTIKDDDVTVLFPDSVEQNARRTLHYINAVKGDIGYQFDYSAMNIPFVIHPENSSSNGMVMWMPLRIEFLSTPSVDSYSMPWVKQLVAHEYRHAVQYNNLDKSTIKFISSLLGQQGAALTLLFPPLYAIEGDAVMMETNMSSYGRGLQPSFSIGYRALADELSDQQSFLKWRCGSYRQYIPDHYQMGYQMMSYAYHKYNENILDRLFSYTARNPQFISPYSIALRKYYDTSTKELLYETFDSLTQFWASQPAVENSAEIVSEIEEQNFTIYSNPIALPSGELLLLKYDYKDSKRFVIFDPEQGSERLVVHTGSVSTRPAYAAGRVWWTEYRRSPLFAEDVNSQLCYMDLESGRTKSLKGFNSALYPTPIGDSADHIAYVEYDPTGHYSVVEIIGGERLSTIAIPYPNEVHSMAWDNGTERLYIIVTGDEGMWIEQQVDGSFEPLTKGAYITISNLTARDGVLYFGSIASGKDEVHSLDIASGVERQLSESTYGSFQGSVAGDELYMTTYDKWGYHLSRQSAEQSVQEVDYSVLPQNVVNPEYKKWSVMNLDTVRFDSVALAQSQVEHKSKRYHKGTHLIDIHSWAPFRFDPFNILSEMTLDVGLGATLVSQNLLSSAEGFLSYGWDRYQGSMVQVGFKYDGLGVEFDLSATYGGEQNVYLVDSEGMDLKRYSGASLSATLPLYFSRGYNNRLLTAYAGWGYSNGILPQGLAVESVVDQKTGTESLALTYKELTEGLNKLSVGLSYTSYVLAAYRDLVTPLGYSLSASYAVDPTNSEFSQLFSLYGKLYTPGLAKNNSFTVAASYQDVVGGFTYEGYSPLSYMSSVLLPHGFSYYDISNNNYFATSASYKFPLCYPEFSTLGLLYFKRLSLGLGADYAQFESYAGGMQSLYAYGADLIIDLNALSMTSASTVTTTLSLYKPKDRDLYFQFSLSLPF